MDMSSALVDKDFKNEVSVLAWNISANMTGPIRCFNYDLSPLASMCKAGFSLDVVETKVDMAGKCVLKIWNLI